MNLEPIGRHQRKALRRSVDIPIELVSRHVDEPLLYWATDLSPFGMWIETPFPMQLGESVVVCFQPGICWASRELQVFAAVERAMGSGRHSGMGLRFVDMTTHEQRALSSWLRWRPPPLPKRRCRSLQMRALPAPQPLLRVLAA